MTTPAQRLERSGGGPPLVAPLVAAAGGQDPREALAGAAKLWTGARGLVRAAGADVATVEFGSRWELEAAGAVLDWSAGYPPRIAGGVPGAAPTGARAAALRETIARVHAALGERALVAASVTGLVRASADRLAVAAPAPGVVGAPAPGADLAAAAKLMLAAVRALCEAGAGLVWIVEDGARPPAHAAAFAQALAPVLATVRAHRASAALHLAGAADGWLDAIRRLRQAIPCFDAARSPALAAALGGGTRAFGVLVAPAATPPALAGDPRCVLVTHDGELAGRIAPRSLRAAARALAPAPAPALAAGRPG
jgi:hypothetical protein